jgi:altronate hydrolase
MRYRAVKISGRDNVAVLVRTVPRGKSVYIPDSHETVVAKQDIQLGHKIALSPIPRGSEIIRYGEAICFAAEDIAPGDWVHVHNTSV